jgi:hypothetical protein
MHNRSGEGDRERKRLACTHKNVLQRLLKEAVARRDETPDRRRHNACDRHESGETDTEHPYSALRQSQKDNWPTAQTIRRVRKIIG